MWILICETVSLPTVCGWETDYLCLPPQPLSKAHVGGTRNLKEKGSGNGAGGVKVHYSTSLFSVPLYLMID